MMARQWRCIVSPVPKMAQRARRAGRAGGSRARGAVLQHQETPRTPRHHDNAQKKGEEDLGSHYFPSEGNGFNGKRKL